MRSLLQNPRRRWFIAAAAAAAVILAVALVLVDSAWWRGQLRVRLLSETGDRAHSPRAGVLDNTARTRMPAHCPPRCGGSMAASFLDGGHPYF